jgi:hypothetical protein
MKATLEFDLNDDGYSWENAIRADDYYSCISDIKEYLRGIDKYGCPDVATMSPDEVIEYVRGKVLDIIVDAGVKF